MNSCCSCITHSPAETRRIGELLGKTIQPGMVITLDGDLGSGKTTFVQGIGKGMDVPPDCYITSPTYTLIHEYPGKYRLFHIDLYRLIDSGEMEDLGLADVLEGGGITVIEWPDRLPPEYLSPRLAIRIAITDDTTRTITIQPDGLERAEWIKGFVKRIEEKKWQ